MELRESFGEFGVAWLPDGRLSCFTARDAVHRMCVGAAPFSSCSASAFPDSITVFGHEGGIWSADGQYLLLPTDPSPHVAEDNLYVISAAGQVSQIVPIGQHGGISWPQRASSHTRLFYYLDSDIVVSDVSLTNDQLTVGPPTVLVHDCGDPPAGYTFALSPSANWLAIECPYGPIDLVSVTNPSQVMHIARATQSGHYMLDPIWSPDGQTMIVFGWRKGSPYSLNIGAYLSSKGLSA